jgi:hypothetical protein
MAGKAASHRMNSLHRCRHSATRRLKRKPAKELVKAQSIALDCRYLNFSPQCDGWHAVTEHGGSGSFVIFFSGLWKLTTAAAIPYYTGQYGKTHKASASSPSAPMSMTSTRRRPTPPPASTP